MIFDANIRLGRLGGSRGTHFCTAKDLLSVMDAHGISRALVYETLARESDYSRGNALLKEKINGHSRLLPCWVAIPNREEPNGLVERMDSCGVPALRLFPTTGHYAIRPWCIGGLARALSEAGKILLLDFEGPSWSRDLIDWEGIYQLASSCPDLRLVVCGVSAAGPTNYWGFIRECPNLHIEISQLSCPGEIRLMAEEGLANRLIFGSDLPKRHVGAPRALVDFEQVSDPVRQMIFYDNLAGLLPPLEELTASPPACPTPRIDPIIDTHVHLGGWNCSSAASGRVEDTIRDMDRCGIQSVIATSLWSCFGEVSLGNDYVARACAAFPGRLYGYLTLDPKHPEEAGQQLNLHGLRPEFRGIKLHGETHGVTIDDPRCAPILTHANARHMPVLVHQPQIHPEPWREVCGRYPEAQFIVAHVGGCGPDDADAIGVARLAREVKNLYFDIAATRNYFGFLDELVALAGADKILYGSDYPIMDFGFELGQVLFGSIDEQEKRQILSGNARRIFDLPPG